MGDLQKPSVMKMIEKVDPQIPSLMKSEKSCVKTMIVNKI